MENSEQRPRGLIDAIIFDATDLVGEGIVVDVTIDRLVSGHGYEREVVEAFFATDTDLTDAVLDYAMITLYDHCWRAAANAQGGPVERMREVARGFVDWAIDHPRQFVVLSARRTLALGEHAMAARYEASIRDMMERFWDEAVASGMIASELKFRDCYGTLRGLVSGLSLLALNSHIPRPYRERALQSLDSFFDMLTSRPGG